VTLIRQLNLHTEDEILSVSLRSKIPKNPAKPETTHLRLWTLIYEEVGKYRLRKDPLTLGAKPIDQFEFTP